MDGNNGKVLSAEQILNRKQAVYFAAIMKEDIENKYSQEASFSSFDTKVMNIVDDIQDAMFTARIESLKTIKSKLDADLKKIADEMNSKNPDYAKANRALNDAAMEFQEFKQQYSILRKNYAQETKGYKVFDDVDAILAKKKFTLGQDFLNKVDAFMKNPVAHEEEKPVVNENPIHVPPANNNQNPPVQPVINAGPVVIQPGPQVNPNNIINQPNPVINQIPQPQVNNNQPVVNPVPNANPQGNDPVLDENNAYVRLTKHIDQLKKSLENDLKRPVGLDFETLLERQAKIRFLERNIEKEDDIRKWKENKENRVEFLNKILANDYGHFWNQNGASLKNRFRNVYEKLNLKKDIILPDSVRKYAANPGANPLTEEKAAEERNRLLIEEPKAVDLYLDDPVGGFTEELKAAIAKDLGFDDSVVNTSEERQKCKDFFNVDDIDRENDPAHATLLDEIGNYSARTHFVANRDSTTTSTFIMYLMGRPENDLSYEEAKKIAPGHPKFEEEVKNFRDFLKENVTSDKIEDNVVKEHVDPQKAHKGAHAWAAVFHKTAEKMNQIVLPDIDYTDIDQVKAHGKEFLDLSAFAIDFGQNLEPFLRDTNPSYLDDVPGGRKALSDRSVTQTFLTNFTSTFSDGYYFRKNSADFSNVSAGNVERYLRRIAGCRAGWGINANEQFRGKRIGDLIKPNANNLIDSYLTQVLSIRLSAERSLDKKTCLAYLTGNSPAYQQRYIELREEEKDHIRQVSFNDNQRSYTSYATTALRHAKEKPGMKDKCRNIFAPGRTGQQIYDDLNKADNAEISDAGGRVFRELFDGGDQPTFFKLGNIDSLSTIRINGRTMEECWGEKYAFLNDPAQKAKMYRSELINEALNGDGDITFDFYSFDKNLNIVPNGKLTIMPGIKNMEKTRKFLKAVSDIHKQMEEIRTSLNNQEVPPAQEDVESFNAIKEAAKKCFDHSKIDGSSNDCNYQTLKNDLKEYLDLTTEYYRIMGILHPAGQGVPNDKKNAMGNLDRLIKEMDIAAEGLRLVPEKDLESTIQSGNSSYYLFTSIKNRLDETSKIRLGRSIDIENPVEVYEGDYSWLNDVDPDSFNVPEDKFPLLNQKLDFKVANQYTGSRYQSGNQIKNMQGFDKEDLTDDPARIHSLFTMWAMANKGMTVEEAATLAETPQIKDGVVLNQAILKRNEDLRKEFFAFAKKYPYVTKPANETTQAEAERVKAWADVFKNAKTRIENYTFPNIDYSDVNQVRLYIKPLMELRAISVDAVQEWPKLEKTTSLEDAAKAMGSEDELEKTRRFYLNLQTAFGTDIMKGYLPADSDPDLPRICRIIMERHDAEELMHDFKGKTIGHFMQEREFELINEDNYRDTIDESLTDGDVSVDPKLSLGYAFGLNAEAYERALDRVHKEAWKQSVRGMEESVYTNYANFREKCLTPEIRKLLMESGDDAESMRALYKHELQNKKDGKNVGDYVNRLMYSHITQTQGGFLQHLGSKKTDLFSIADDHDFIGKSPKELWGEKYANLSEDEREYMYRLEILKVIAKGEKRVLMDIYSKKPENPKGISHTRKTAFASRQTFQEMLLDAGRYKAEKDKLLSELKNTRALLTLTHDKDKRDYNFTDKNTTGSTQYQNMCKALQNVIELLEKDGTYDGEKITPEQIENSLRILEQTSNVYYNGHFGRFFRPFTDNGTLRLNMSARMKDGLVSRFTSFRTHLNQKVFTKTAKDFDEVSAYTAIREIKRLISGYGLEYKGDDYHYNSVIKEELKTKLETLKNSPAVTDRTKDSAEISLAKDYLLAVLENYNNAPANGVGAKKQSASMLRLIDHFEDKARILAVDPVFIRLMKANPEDCINRWESIEEGELKLKDDYNNTWRSFTNGYKDPAHYALGITDADVRNGITIQSKIAELANDPEGEDLLDAFYDQAAKVIITQKLAEDNDEASFYREEIVNDPQRYNELLAKANAFLKSQNALSAGNLSKFITKMNEENYKLSFFKRLETEEKQAERAKETQIKNAKNEELNKISFLLQDYDGQKLTADQYDMANATLHLYDIQKLTADVDRAAGYLRNSMTVLDEKDQKVTIQPDVNVYSKCSFAPDRLPSTQVVMILFAMSKKGMSLEEAIKVTLTVPNLSEQGEIQNKEAYDRAMQLRYDFYTFCEKHPVDDPNLSQDQLKENFKAWAGIYRDGTAKFMTNKLPEINYRDAEQVSANIKKIGMINRIIIDADQEFTRLFNTNTNGIYGLNVVKEEVGGEKEFLKIKNNWWNLSSMMNFFENGYVDVSGLRKGACVNFSIDSFRGKILDAAVMRCMAQQEMNANRGKTFEEIAASSPVRALTQKQYVANLKSAVSNIYDDQGIYYDGLSPEDAIKFTLGIDKENFERGIAKIANPYLADAKEDRYKNQISKAVLYRDDFTVDEVCTALVAIPDHDAESVKKFLTQKVNPNDVNSPTGDAWLTEKIGKTGNGLFNQETCEICQVAKISPSDIVRIDGKSPEELWGAKYADVKDEELKEKLYRLEIIKELAKAEKDITIRVFRVEDRELREDSPINLLPKKAVMKNLIDAVHVYEAGKIEMQKELNRFKSQLNATQSDPLANFTSGRQPEGDEQYREMTKGLKNLLFCFEKDHVNEKDIKVRDFREWFDYTLEMAQEYERTHSGKTAENEKIRLDVCRKMQEVLPRMKETYERLRKGFEPNIPVKGKENTKDGSYHRIRESLLDISAKWNIQAENEAHYEKRFIREETIARLDKIKDAAYAQNAQAEADPIKAEDQRYVREYLDYVYRTKANNDQMTADELQRFDDTYKEKAKALASDRVFLDYVKRLGNKKVAEMWDNIEVNANKMLTTSENHVLDMKQAWGSLTGYVSKNPRHRDPNFDLNAWNKECKEIIKDAMNESDIFYDTSETMYTRLATALTWQMMSRDTEAGKYLRTSVVAAGGLKSERGKAVLEENILNVTNILKAYDVLENKNIDMALRQLENGRLVDDMDKEFISNLDWNRTEKAKGNAADKENLINVAEPLKDKDGPILLFDENNDNEIDNEIKNNDEIGFNLNLNFDDNENDIQQIKNLDKSYGQLYDQIMERSEKEVDNNNIINTNEIRPENNFAIQKADFIKFMQDGKQSLQTLLTMKEDDYKEQYPNDWLKQFNTDKAKHFSKMVFAKELLKEDFVFGVEETLQEAELRCVFGGKGKDYALKQKAFAKVVEAHSPEELADLADQNQYKAEFSKAFDEVKKAELQKENPIKGNENNDLNKGNGHEDHKEMGHGPGMGGM